MSLLDSSLSVFKVPFGRARFDRVQEDTCIPEKKESKKRTHQKMTQRLKTIKSQLSDLSAAGYDIEVNEIDGSITVLMHANEFEPLFQNVYEVECGTINNAITDLNVINALDSLSMSNVVNYSYAGFRYNAVFESEDTIKQTNLQTGTIRTIKRSWHNGFYHDLVTVAGLARQSYKPGICFHIQFPMEYPHKPPFVRVMRPRFVFHTGHVTIGGSICAEQLTDTGWSSKYTVVALLSIIKGLLVEGKGQVDLQNYNEYTDGEARAAFTRVRQQHGW